MTTVVITISNPTGQGKNETLTAVIDETIPQNVIPQMRLADLLDKLQVAPSDLSQNKTFVDSRGAEYTARSKVRLVARPRGAAQTALFDFYVVDSGRFDVLLSKGWMDKFPAKDPREHVAAPTELLKDDSAQAKKAEEESKKHLEEAAKAQAIFEKRRREQQAK